jgi:hypothetical protein
MPAEPLPTLDSLDALAELLDRQQGLPERLYVRWSRGPEADLRRGPSSTDELTGAPMPGLSANPLAVEDWWGDRPVGLWVARRLHDYSHLRHEKGPDVRPWVLRGRVAGHGPDNEALLGDVEPVAWVSDAVIAEAEQVVAGQDERWGPLSRWH